MLPWRCRALVALVLLGPEIAADRPDPDSVEDLEGSSESWKWNISMSGEILMTLNGS